jgi:hypothetical protein
MTFVVFLLPANIRGVYHYDMRSRPHALRPASTSVHANTNIAYLGSPGFSFDELCLLLISIPVLEARWGAHTV